MRYCAGTCAWRNGWAVTGRTVCARRRTRQRRFPVLAGDRRRAVSVAYGMPLPMCDTLTVALGTGRAEAVMAAFGKRPPLSLRVNPLRTDTAALTARLAAAGAVVKVGHYGGTPCW